MCHYIKLVLPAQAGVEALREVVKRHGRLLEPSSEPHVEQVLRPDERAYLTGGNCDCGTGLVTRPAERGEHEDDREVAKLRRSGWSEAKIGRWREQRGADVTRKEESKARSRDHDAEEWRALVSDLLDAKVDHVGLLVHWVTDEVRRGPVLPRSSVNTETMAKLEENVLYTFSRRF